MGSPDYSSVVAQNTTFSGEYALATSSGYYTSLSLKNCILANVVSIGITPTGNNNGFYQSPPFGTSTFTNTFYPFQTAGAGAYYLANGCNFTNKGTANIDATLLAGLKQKTTMPPIVYSNITFSTATNFSPQARRDTNSSPDLGYHYDPIDYCFGGVTAQSNVTFTAGTAFGWFELPGSGGPGYGIALKNDIFATFNGTATSPCIFARYDTVQEGGNGLWKDKGWLGGMENGDSYDQNNPAGLTATFTHFSHLAGDPSHFRDGTGNQPIVVQAKHCEFYGGAVGCNMLAGYTNCLFYRAGFGISNALAYPYQIYINCTFYGGSLNFGHSEGGVPYWYSYIHDCAFDGTTFSVGDPFGSNTNYADYNYNAFNSGAAQPPTEGANTVTVTGGFNWQSNWFGNYYLPPNSSLIDAGDQTAGQLGLAFFTTQTNQMMELNTVVDIGYHYVAVNTNGLPFTDTNGVPYYQQSGFDPDGSGLPLWWQLQYFGTTGVDPYGNPAGDGWNNLQKFQNGMNPNVFYTPPAPQGLAVNYNSANNTAQISWSPSPGPVTGYTVERDYYWWSSPQSFNVTGGATAIGDNSVPGVDYDYFWANGPLIPVSYKVQAHYAGGDSAWSESVPLESNPQSLFIGGTPPVSIIPGPQGSAYLAAPVLPPGTVALRVWRYDAAPYDPSPLTNFDISISSVTNGLYLLPASWTVARTNVYGFAFYEYWIQPVLTNAGLGSAGSVSDEGYFGAYYSEDSYSDEWLVPPYFDGRAQLKQNLIFQLRAATKDFPFEYTATWWSYNPWMVFSNSPNYVYAGFYQLDEIPNQYSTYEQLGSFDPFWPFENNWRYRNFVFSPQDAGATTNFYYSRYGLGHILTSVFGNYDNYYSDWSYYNQYHWPTPLVLGPPYPDSNLLPYFQPEYVFHTPAGLTNGTTISSVLDNSQWLVSYGLDSPEYYWDPGLGAPVGNGYLDQIGITNYFDDQWNEYYTMFGNARNFWGLPFLSAKITYDDGTGTGIATTVLSAGNTTMQDGYFYSEVAQPQFQTAEYDFWNKSPLPGMTNFVNGQASDLLIAPVGGSTMVNGYAKLAVLNGYTGVYGYLGQYFDKAYKLDALSNVTTNQTGLLSPYGQFFATEPGPAALVTMPDIDTGQRGTGVVWCASMPVDKNHDGILDLSFSGTDATSVASPMVAWVNNGLIIPGTSGNLDHGVQVATNSPRNYSYGQITCQRDLENFFRLWICGLPSFPSSQGYSVTLSCSGISGSPAINLYMAETNGGIGYLTDTNVAQSMVGEISLGTISTNSGIIFPTNFFDGSNKYFLFEGAGIGEGQFTLTIYQNGNIIAQTSTYIDLHDIKDLYEQAHVTNVIQTWPEMVQQSATSGFQVDHYLPGNSSQANQLAVFVHGWRMTQFDYGDFSDTMFKRLYWQGYQGKFASLRWPTRSADTDTNGLDYLTFNRSEYIAFESGTGAAEYFNNLRQRFTNDTISVCAHSQGNIVMMEALKELALVDQTPLDNYVIMQAAVPAHCYDTTVANFQPFLDAESNILPTPNTYLNYAAGITNALRKGIINFFNPVDYALATATNSLGFNISWEGNEEWLKPLVFFGYYYNATNGVAGVTTNQFNAGEGVIPRIVTDPWELMPFVARPRSLAAGGRSGISNLLNVNREVNLQTTLGFNDKDYDHSGEFNRNIQTPQVQGFYDDLLSTLFLQNP